MLPRILVLNYVFQAGLELMAIHPQPPQCWDYRSIIIPGSLGKSEQLRTGTHGIQTTLLQRTMA